MTAAVRNDLRWRRRHRAVSAPANIWQRLGAVWAIDARYSTPGERTVRNLGYGGAALDARYGSAPTPNTNDPTLVGTSSVYLPGVNGNNISVASEPSFTPTFQQSIRFAGDHQSWRPSTTEFFATVNTTAGTNRCWSLGLTTGCQLRYSQSILGAVSDFDRFSPDLGIPAGTRAAVRVDWTSAGGVIEFYWKPLGAGDPLALIRSNDGWTFAGTAAGATSPLFASTEPLRIGAHAGTSFYTGNVFAVSVVSDGVEVAAHSSNATLGQSSFPLVTGQTATVNRSTTGRKTVVNGADQSSVWLFGSDDYLVVPNHPLLEFTTSESLTAILVLRDFANATGYALQKGTVAGGAGQQGYVLRKVGLTSYLMVQSELTDRQTPNTPATYGARQVMTGIYRGATSQATVQIDGTVSAPAGPLLGTTLSSAQPLYVGGSPGFNYDGVVTAGGIFRGELTPDQIAVIRNEYPGV